MAELEPSRINPEPAPRLSIKDQVRTSLVERMEEKLKDPTVGPKKRARIEFNLVMTENKLAPKPLGELVEEVRSLPTQPISKEARQWLEHKEARRAAIEASHRAWSDAIFLAKISRIG